LTNPDFIVPVIGAGGRNFAAGGGSQFELIGERILFDVQAVVSGAQDFILIKVT
jgi:hypothetical protein